MTLPDYESLGAFYLGRPVDPATGADRPEPLLYDARDLTTHAVCVGMTGSGKTGLCLSLLEEAAIDGVPIIAIDPKGDLGNLLLTFPDLAAESFAPWVDPAEAARKGLTVDAFAAKTAETWRKGLADWDQDAARIRRFRDAAEVRIYTPGSESGRPLSVLRSFRAPPPETLKDATALRERIGATVSGLLGMIGIQADPVQSREHILLSSLFANAWSGAVDLDLPAIIQGVQKPPFDKVGLFDLETFYPAKDRLQLAMGLNNLLASPGFSAWMQGEPLDVQRLLYDDHGKPRISIVSVAHLNDAERMFVVTLVLSEVVAWMRRQSGTSSLRAIVYMDEIFGYFPPTATPPAKLPLLTLMKQARAFGVGVVLATQNPVDLDYKGLSNAGTWFIGRLQTERDKARLMEGLIGAGDETLDRSTLEKLLANLGNRVFLMRNVHEDAPVLFRTRWALSYLRGPLTLQEIARLTPQAAGTRETVERTADPSPRAPRAGGATRPMVPSTVPEYFTKATASEAVYAASVLATARVHFIDKKADLDRWESRTYLVPPTEAGELDWARASIRQNIKATLDAAPIAGAQFREPPGSLLHAPSYKQWRNEIQDHIYREERLKVFRCRAVAQQSDPGEDEATFRARLVLALREKRDAEIEKLRSKYAQKMTSLDDQLRRASERIERERAQLSDRRMDTALSVGTSILGALFGRKRISATNIGRVGSAARSAGRIGREQQDVARAEASREVIEQRREELARELEGEIQKLQSGFDPATIEVEEVEIAPRKSDIDVSEVALVWTV